MPGMSHKREGEERENAKRKTPFRRTGRGALFQTELELVDDVGRDQPGIMQGWSTALLSAVSGAGAVGFVVPAHFEAAENVFPEVILHRAGQRQDFGGISRSGQDLGPAFGLPEVFRASVQAQLFSGLIRGIEGDVFSPMFGNISK